MSSLKGTGSPSAELSACLQRQLDALEAASPGLRDSLPSGIRESLPLVFAASDFVAQACARDTGLLPDLIGRFAVARRSAPGDYAARAPVADCGSEADMLSLLRRWRRREMVRIAWRALAGWAEVEETLADLSDFADAAIRASLEHARQTLADRYGEPRSASGAVQPLVVIAMGKLGGRELNFSSDVDLMLLFPEHGETDGARPIANEEFFTRLGQSLIRLLETPTQDGFTLRVDMRLRPFGDSGPLVTSFASLEDYLPLHGRDWERYAYVKARPVTAVERYAEIRAAALGPFVYRRYLDYGVFESLREMKALIEREVERRELADHIKLGPGGIREIEFIVQAFQLIRGGRERRLQTSSLLQALGALGEMPLMPGEAVAELRAAYLYLRRLENSLQMLSDRQAHQLPADALAQERIALAMGARDWSELRADLARHQARVSSHFHRFVLGGSLAQRGAAVRIDLGRLWDEGAEAAVLAESLGRAGFAEPRHAAQMLLALRASALVRKLDEPGRKRLQGLLPPLLEDIGAARLADADEQHAVLRRIISILEATGKRSAYFALLRESQAARSRLIEVCRHGDFLARQIASYPLLLDELVDERLLSELPEREALARELQLAMQELAEDDPERQVEALCHLQRAAVFRIAVADLTGRLPVMRVSDRLTELAEVIIARAMELAWGQITAQFGVPHCGETEECRPVSICAVGYGKLGGLELGYASDLDLVFLHDSRGERQETDGTRPIDNALFFVRLAQRLVHLLTMHSAAGRLYEVDVRLRPSGKGGLLVTQIDAFAEYQRREAWTWEHQALLHARAVAGSPQLCAQFERTRLDVLRYAVRREGLRDEVRAMRERMRRELSKGGHGRLDLKQDAGGIADIEFLAQYWALAWAREYPPVAMFSDTIRQLESVASADLVPQTTVDVLTAAYRAYRTRIHHLSLAGEGAVIAAEEFAGERAAVTAIWQDVMVRTDRV
ncbi:MAG TPA: bifunctional [glutamate--ammonia ligase]-adenylyl-L-tyrosine phosphorylase/[glutamate--ammonia-ligase] adenylyltransferase [Steroidobacteraceae bacterium]|nr:bifunctional [glutamate--ammonia ligase]-adenylyl-L-tyrosine phosphorylase/[glutamate--ammonia-ligase] adenylyltransferase [Steroidobacteraceae bacterium]